MTWTHFALAALSWRPSRIVAGALGLAAFLSACEAGDSEDNPPAEDTATEDTAAQDTAQPEQPADAQRSWWQFGLADDVLDEVALHYLGQTWHQSADVGEVLETVSRVDAADPESWQNQWKITASRLEAVAQEAEDAGHDRSAAHAWLRAATYHRATLHRYMDPFADEVASITEREIAAFERYLELSGSPCAPVDIPYEDTTLPGYFCESPEAAGEAPTIIFHEGKDGWAEDGKFVADEAMARGMNVLMFDGPGIGKTLRLQGLPFRVDWENVIGPVIDFLEDQPSVDEDRIGLFAVSLGGFLAPRAAAYEDRLSVLVANPGVMDWFVVYEEALSAIDPNLMSLLDVNEDEFNGYIEQAMQHSDFLRWGLVDSMWHHGVQTPADLMNEIRRYRLDGLEKQITAKTLVVDAEAEERGQAWELYEALDTDKDYLLFTAEEAAQFHVQPGATAIGSARIFDWLEDNL